MKVLICDDNVAYLNEMEDITCKWSEERKQKVIIHKTKNPEEAARWMHFHRYEVALLDIEMPGMDGVELARKLKEENPDVFIMLVTNHSGYVYKAFDVKVQTYIEKEYMHRQIPEQLDRAEEEMNKQDEMFDYQVQRSSCIIGISRIKYFEALGHKMVMHTDKQGNEETIEFRDSMKNIMDKLPPNIFKKISRSIIVNLKYIEEIRRGTVILKGDVELNVTDSYYDELRIARLDLYGSR